MKFYTNVAKYGNAILVRENVDGIPSLRKDMWKPTLYVKDLKTQNPEFTTLYGDLAKSIQPGSMSETKAWIKQYDGLDGFDIFGQTNEVLQYCNEYPHTGWAFSKIKTFSIDIETAAAPDGGFPDPKFALGMVQLITIQNVHTKRCFTWGTKKYTPTKYYSVNTSYTLCKSEKDLLKQFLLFWESEKPDVVTGWNIDGFDIPYLMNRIESILGREYTKKLSPWGFVDIGLKTYKGVEEISYSITGVAVLDYMLLYKKFTFGNHESYSLAGISSDELDKTKLENPTEGFEEFFTGKTRIGMDSPDAAKYFSGKADYYNNIVTTNSIYYLSILANTKHDVDCGIDVLMPNKIMLDAQANTTDHLELFTELAATCYSTFVEYNVQDTVLVTMLDDKLKLLELALTISYEAKVNYADVYSPVKTWDAIIHNHLLAKNIVSPQRQSTGDGYSIEGAYVKTPVPGMYKNVVSFDFTSLYPSIMMAINISPETYLGQCNSDIDRCLAGDFEIKDPDVCMGVNGATYDRTKLGAIPEIIKIYMKKRRDAKNEMLEVEKEIELIKTELSSL